METDDRLLVDYLRRAYHAADGLWFVVVEDAHGFEHALGLDARVWQVLAKIQARKARELTGACTNSPADLARCFSLKLAADGHRFEVAISDREVCFTVRGCPWLELLRHRDRRHLAARIAQTVCPTEGRTWCAEFGGEYEFQMPAPACAGGYPCVLRFFRAGFAAAP